MVGKRSSEMVTPAAAAADDDNDNKTIMTIIPKSVTSVLSNHDLLFEILLRLPVLSLMLFKSVSKHWCSIITSPCFVTSRSKIPKIDPPFGLLTQRDYLNRFQCHFESFDIRVPSRKSIGFTLGLDASHGRVKILQSCNGLLLCCSYNYCSYNYDHFYVCNPTINQFKIPTNSNNHARMLFDPAKSPHYKIIQINGYGQSQMYLSETESWSVCGDTFCSTRLGGFETGLYWNDAIHWLNPLNDRKRHSKLDIQGEHLVLTEFELPLPFDFDAYFESKLFECRGCLLLLNKDRAHPFQLNVYEMRHGYTEWSVKYIVNLDDNFKFDILPSVCYVVLGERQEELFMIIDLFTKVVQYNPILKTVHTLDDSESLGWPHLSEFHGFLLIASLAVV